ncbi:hypothetical protein NKI80_29600 [Mesorhizobium sp. M0387]|uniref:hypothetical protein n=1 Tax=Mesorhizobium sp. M0387 TaxID=2956940 RepID=UPI00333DF8E6
MSEETDIPVENPVPVPPPVAPDNRQLWEWRTKYEDAAPQIRREASILGFYLLFFGISAIGAFSYAGDFTINKGDPPQDLFHLERRDVLCWIVGSVGGTVFAIKWLVFLWRMVSGIKTGFCGVFLFR